jgi:hypothetical protein
MIAYALLRFLGKFRHRLRVICFSEVRIAKRCSRDSNGLACILRAEPAIERWRSRLFLSCKPFSHLHGHDNSTRLCWSAQPGRRVARSNAGERRPMWLANAGSFTRACWIDRSFLRRLRLNSGERVPRDERFEYAICSTTIRPVAVACICCCAALSVARSSRSGHGCA